MPNPSLPEPAFPRPPQPRALAYPAGAFAAPPRTLLLVEDSRHAAEAVRILCRRMGIRLRRTESLAGAALHLRVYRPDIALIDLGLPDGSGLDLIRAMARSTARPGRVVAISGDPTLDGAAQRAGADAFLAKPLSFTRHLASLTGDAGDADSITDWRHNPMLPEFGQVDRNAGADPLALRDDLTLAGDLLGRSDDPEDLRYAGQFLASIGRSLSDEPLAEAARQAGRTGDRRTLAEMIRRRIAASPLI